MVQLESIFLIYIWPTASFFQTNQFSYILSIFVSKSFLSLAQLQLIFRPNVKPQRYLLKKPYQMKSDNMS